MSDFDVGSCRFYENKYPQPDELVMVRVNHLADVAAYVSLLEYNNMEGMILFTELSRKRIRSISQFIRVGKLETVQVLRVDEKQGYIDLSKKKVSTEDAAACEERYNKAKMVHSILKNVAKLCEVKLETLYETLVWPLNRKYGNAHDALKRAVNEPSILNEYAIPERVREEMLKSIQLRLKPQPVRVRADVDITCFTKEGIDSIKAALHAGLAVPGTAEIPISIKLVSPPSYVFLATAMDKDAVLSVVDRSIEAVATTIRSLGGDVVVQQKARVISEREDKKMQNEISNATNDLDADEEGSESDEDGSDEEGEGASSSSSSKKKSSGGDDDLSSSTNFD
nr:eukaryotic translation initiation factor 2 subunit 1/alpha [Seculamonas ecuadoriensis]